jgi:SAM-dependent methyltransferase
MMNLFRRGEGRGGTESRVPPGPHLVSHILIKFLKRLRAMDRPNLLDLGRLSGPNIEFFARAGCRVRVEDVLSALDVEAREPDEAAPPPRDPAAVLRASEAPGRPPSPVGPGSAVREAAAGRESAHAPAPAGIPLHRPGTRPSRRIVLPPRTFPRPGIPGARQGAAAGAALPLSRPGASSGRPAPVDLPTSLPFPDESFDAVVAWDVFSYYDPDRARTLAAETRRILRPGGLVLSYFHARRSESPQCPERYRIVDDGRVSCEPHGGRPLPRQVYQNRDIEKMFTGLKILELYFLKNAVREILMEKKPPAPANAARIRPATPPPRFTIE